MPIYEYVCPQCNARFELLRPASRSNDSASCPRCATAAGRTLSTFCAVSKDGEGAVSTVGGSSCNGCSGLSCSTCGR